MALHDSAGIPAQFPGPAAGACRGAGAGALWVRVPLEDEDDDLDTGRAVGVGVGVGVGTGVGGGTYGGGVTTMPWLAATGGCAARPGNATAIAVATPPLITAAATTSAMR